MSETKVEATKRPISFHVPDWRKAELEREAAEFGAAIGKPTSLSEYVRVALDAFSQKKAA